MSSSPRQIRASTPVHLSVYHWRGQQTAKPSLVVSPTTSSVFGPSWLNPPYLHQKVCISLNYPSISADDPCIISSRVPVAYIHFSPTILVECCVCLIRVLPLAGTEKLNWRVFYDFFSPYLIHSCEIGGACGSEYDWIADFS